MGFRVNSSHAHGGARFGEAPFPGTRGRRLIFPPLGVKALAQCANRLKMFHLWLQVLRRRPTLAGCVPRSLELKQTRKPCAVREQPTYWRALLQAHGLVPGRGEHPFCQGSLKRPHETLLLREGTTIEAPRPRRGNLGGRVLAIAGTLSLLGAGPVGQPLDEANALKQADACPEAVRRYDEVLATSVAGDGAWGPALYNRSVCLELLDRFDEALLGYDLLVRADVFALDARFRRGLVQVALGELRAARRGFASLRPRLRGMDRLAVDVQIGALDAELGRARRAVAVLSPAVEALREQQPEGTWYLAQALVAMGDLHADASRRIRLRPPRVARRLGRRADRLATGMQFYGEASALHEPTWAAAATLHLGEAFLGLARELDELRQRLEAAPRRTPEDQAILAFLAQQVPNTAGKARDSLRLCELVFTETGLDDASTRACRAELEAFPEELLRAP